MIYLASPYSSPLPEMREHRFKEVEKFVAGLMKERSLLVFSPTLYTHQMSIKHGWPYEAEAYMQFNLDMLRHSQAFFLLQMQGWRESKGVQIELGIAKALMLPITEFRHESDIGAGPIQ